VGGEEGFLAGVSAAVGRKPAENFERPKRGRAAMQPREAADMADLAGVAGLGAVQRVDSKEGRRAAHEEGGKRYGHHPR